MLMLNNLRSPKGANKKNKRIGRGQGSGRGTQAGKGHKGQNARKGKNTRTGFEGGNMPLYLHMPKRGLFTNYRFKKMYAIVTLEQILSKFENNETVSPQTLAEKGLVKGQNKNYPVKVLGNNKGFDKKLAFEGIDKFSKSALDLVNSTNCKIGKSE